MWRWDIFCKVIDNYGDIGTCWRLAQQLAGEHEAEVRLWVDQLQSFAQLCPAVSIDAERQHVGRIEICRWRPDIPVGKRDRHRLPERPEGCCAQTVPVPFSEVEVADVVIEAFACEPPESYLAAMAKKGTVPICRNGPKGAAHKWGLSPFSPPVWINLEYLSAEAWVEECHRSPSLRGRWPLDKYFFFPGFTARTGGLLRERNLLADRAAFDAAAETEFWHSLGVPARSPTPEVDRELRVSMFCYDNAPLSPLLECWASGPDAATVLAAPGPAADQISGWLGEPLLPGVPLRRSSLTAYALPFLPQASFDRLLWSCDVNFVRGEDSFVRAQWASRPLVWQIYPQTEGVHWLKLEAFLDRYLERFAGTRYSWSAAVVRRFWRAWNGRGDIAAAWPDFVAQRRALEQHGKAWANRLDQMGDLAENLVSFVRGIRIGARSMPI